MKKNYLLLIKSIFVLLILLSFGALKQAIAQTKTPPKLPHMWVSQAHGGKRKNHFEKGKTHNNKESKFTYLSRHLGSKETQSILCPKKNMDLFFNSLDSNKVKFIRIYIAAYNEDSGGMVPANMNKHLTIVLAPADKDTIDVDDYYNISPDGLIVKIDKEVMQGWVNYYVDEKMKVLLQTFNGNEEENRFQGKTPSDTRSILYRMEDFLEFLMAESKYQKTTHGIDMTGIRIDFASHTEEGIPDVAGCPSPKYKYKNRLILQFEYTQKVENDNYKVFYIRENEGREKQCPFNFRKNQADLVTADNGQICPANCPKP